MTCLFCDFTGSREELISHSAECEFHPLYVEASVVKILQTRLDFLAEAARAVIIRWDSIDWKNTEHTGVVIDRLRAALANEVKA